MQVDKISIENAFFLIIDLEATCNNDDSFPREEMEIIEIGAVMLDARSYEIVSEYQTFIRPVRHPVLTPFCTELTSIVQADVDAAKKYPEVMESFREWMSGYDDALFCSWGNYDRSQFEKDCRFHQVPYPFGPVHMNLKAEFSRCFNRRKQSGLGGALKSLGLSFEGTHHRGIDDARNIARIVRHLGQDT